MSDKEQGNSKNDDPLAELAKIIGEDGSGATRRSSRPVRPPPRFPEDEVSKKARANTISLLFVTAAIMAFAFLAFIVLHKPSARVVPAPPSTIQR